jgi:hypothetical protein
MDENFISIYMDHRQSESPHFHLNHHKFTEHVSEATATQNSSISDRQIAGHNLNWPGRISHHIEPSGIENRAFIFRSKT